MTESCIEVIRLFATRMYAIQAIHCHKVAFMLIVLCYLRQGCMPYKSYIAIKLHLCLLCCFIFHILSTCVLKYRIKSILFKFSCPFHGSSSCASSVESCITRIWGKRIYHFFHYCIFKCLVTLAALSFLHVIVHTCPQNI